MMDEGDDGARVGVWVTVGVITLLLFGLIGGLAIRQVHQGPAQAKAKAQAAVARLMAPAAPPAMIDAPISGELLGKIYFNSGAMDMTGDGPTTVAMAGVALAQAPASAKLVLSGFHDATGDAARNAELAKQRAQAVRDALLAAGVDAERVSLRKPESATGEGKPEEARRVEVRLVP